MSSRRLVLFDIDGTLLSAGRASRDALSRALADSRVEDVALDGHDFSGKTDPQIVRELLDGHVEPETMAALVGDVLVAYVSYLEELATPEAILPKKGIADLLAGLAVRPDVTLALLTGNLERGARLKLAPPQFNGYFRFGAFGSDHEDRYRLPAIAVSRAETETGHRFRSREIVIVGDSVHDVACGRPLGVKTVAVATGVTSRKRLAAERPDHLFDDFSDVGAALETMVA